LQLPLNTLAPMEATGNIPLAPGTLAAAASIPPENIVGQETVDTLGDSALLDHLVDRNPRLVAFSLYMWNSERSAWMAAELKKRIPGLITVGGGPEVHEDNRWLLESRAFDLLVSGEGEEIARRVLNPAEASRIARESGGFIRSPTGDFPPGAFPNPWLTGHLDPGAGPVHIETMRGCPFTCVYCSYRRTSPSPRIMRAEEAASLLRLLSGKGAREIIFLDPAFNIRPDLELLLKAMEKLPTEFFAEMRGETITREMARLTRRAGFTSVELGLQSTNPKSLALSGRTGDPAMVLRGASYLAEAGLKTIMDVMLGLPGDTTEDTLRTVSSLVERNLHHEVQVFFTSVLPGTPMRKNFPGDYMRLPPYYGFTGESLEILAASREKIADMLGYDLDFPARPVLFDGWPGTFTLDLDDEAAEAPRSEFRLTSLRVTAKDHWADVNLLVDVVKRMRADNPFRQLDLVLLPSRPFPVNLLEILRRTSPPVDYYGRVSGIVGREGNLRIAVLTDDPAKTGWDWLMTMAGHCTVAVDVPDPADLPGKAWETGVCARLPGNSWNMEDLARRVYSMHQLFFVEKSMERLWSEFMGIL